MPPRLILALALLATAAAPPPDPARQKLDARVFDRVWSLIRDRYWDSALRSVDWDAAQITYRPRALAAPDEHALYAVLDAMVRLLDDSHVAVTSPGRRRYDEARGRRDDEEAGFGFDAERDGESWRVAHLASDGPAERAGIEIGWRIAAIDGAPPDIDRHYGLDETATVRLIDDDGRTRDIALTGAVVAKRPARAAERLDGGVLLLRFDEFDAGLPGWIAQALRDPPSRALVLDLRGNDGGRDDILDHVAGLFIGSGVPLLRLSGRHGGETESSQGAAAFAGPIAVLIGPDTASAAEALAAALAERHRAITIGACTAGALTAGVERRLPDGGVLTIAEQDIRTAGGARIEGRGLDPQIAIAATLADRRAGRDPVLAEALRRLGGEVTRSDRPARAGTS